MDGRKHAKFIIKRGFAHTAAAFSEGLNLKAMKEEEDGWKYLQDLYNKDNPTQKLIFVKR